MPGLEGLPALLLLEGDRLLGDVAVLVGGGQVAQPLRGGCGVDGRRRAVLADDGAAGGVDRLGCVHGEAFVLRELAGVAADVVLLGDLAVRHHLRPRLRRGLDEVLAVVEQPAVAGLRGGVHLAVVRRGLHRRRQQTVRVDGHLVGQRLEPALRSELRGPDHVHVDDVVVLVLGLEVLHEVVVLLVGLVGLLLEGHLLARVRLVPLGDRRADHVAVVLALDVGDGPTGGQGGAGVTAAAAPVPPTAATTGSHPEKCGHGQCRHHRLAPHVRLPSLVSGATSGVACDSGHTSEQAVSIGPAAPCPRRMAGAVRTVT